MCRARHLPAPWLGQAFGCSPGLASGPFPVGRCVTRSCCPPAGAVWPRASGRGPSIPPCGRWVVGGTLQSVCASMPPAGSGAAALVRGVSRGWHPWEGSGSSPASQCLLSPAGSGPHGDRTPALCQGAMWSPGALSRGHWGHVGDVRAKGPGRVARVAGSSASWPPAVFSRPPWAGGPSTQAPRLLAGCAQAPGSRAGQTPPGAGYVAAALGRTASRGGACTAPLGPAVCGPAAP